MGHQRFQRQSWGKWHPKGVLPPPRARIWGLQLQDEINKWAQSDLCGYETMARGFLE